MGGQTISVAISRVVIVYKPIESIWGDSSNKPQSIQLYYKSDCFAWGTSHFCKSTKLRFLRGNFLLKSAVTFGFITQSKLLGGSTPQTPERISFSRDAYTRLFIFLYQFNSH